MMDGRCGRWMACCALLALGRHRDVASGAQILALMPFPAKSHWNVMDAVLQTLVDRGHNVTAITPFLKRKQVVNYTEVDISDLTPSGVSVPWAQIMGIGSEANSIPFLSSRHRLTCQKLFDDERFWHVIHSNRFDLFVTELLASSCDAYVSYHLNVPRAVIVSSHMHTWYHHALGSHTNPAHVATLNAPFAVPANLMQRMANAYDYVFSHLVFEWADRGATALGRKYFGPDAPDARGLMSNTSLVFVNGHHTVDLAKPQPPNFVDIGGVHLAQPKPLPDYIERYINESRDGVIYFTFGSTIKMDTAPMRLQKAFVEALGELSQRVLWKYESQIVGESPKNVIIKKWFPQRDILEHKNVKLFISHGGMSGIYEAIDSGVPVLGIPLFFDQPHNIANLVHWGAGEMLDHQTLTKDVLVKAIKHMIADYDKYKSNMMELSRRFKDRPRTPKEEIIYWTEYVIRHKGAYHLKSAALELAWYQYVLIDVLIVVLLVILLISYAIYRLTRALKNHMFGLKKSKKD